MSSAPSTPPPPGTTAHIIPISSRGPLRQASSSASLGDSKASSFSARLPLSFDVDGIPHFSSTMTTPPHSPSLRGASRLARRSGSLGGATSPSSDTLSLGSTGIPPAPPNTIAPTEAQTSFEGMDKKTAEKALRAMEEEQEAVTLSLLKRLETLNEEKASIARTLESDSINRLLHQTGHPISPLCTPSSPLGPFASSLPSSAHHPRSSPPTLHLTPQSPSHSLAVASTKTPTLATVPRLPGSQSHDLAGTLFGAATFAEALARRVDQLERSALECWKYAESARRELIHLSQKFDEPITTAPLPPHPLSHAYSTPAHPVRGRGATITSSTSVSPSHPSPEASALLRSGSGTHLGVGRGATLHEGSAALKGIGVLAAAGPSWRTAESGQLGRRESIGTLSVPAGIREKEHDQERDKETTEPEDL